jgi:hypothetical protein
MATDYRQDFPDTVRVWDEICGTSSTLRFCLCHFYNTYDTSPTVCYYEKKLDLLQEATDPVMSYVLPPTSSCCFPSY